MRREHGFTLIEILISISIAAIITLALNEVMVTAFLSWRSAVAEVEIARNSEDVMNKIIEGDDRSDGIKGAVEILSAAPTSVSFVPAWTDEYESVPPEGKYRLTKNLRSSAPAPMVMARFPGDYEFQTLPVTFTQGSGEGTSRHDYFSFNFPVPEGTVVRASYHPDAKTFPETVMTYGWNPKDEKFYRIYRGESEDFLPKHEKLRITNVHFSYYDSLNRLIETAGEERPGGRNMIPGITAVGIAVEFTGLELSRTVESFAAIRALGKEGSGVIVSEGAELLIPDSEHIQTLILTDLDGIKRDNHLDVTVETPNHSKSWRVRFRLDLDEGIPLVSGYDIEYPVGKVAVKSDDVESAEYGIDLLKVGSDGLYDYDEDPGISDIVFFRGNEVKLTITKMDIKSARLLMRP